MKSLPTMIKLLLPTIWDNLNYYEITPNCVATRPCAAAPLLFGPFLASDHELPLISADISALFSPSDYGVSSCFSAVLSHAYVALSWLATMQAKFDQVKREKEIHTAKKVTVVYDDEYYSIIRVTIIESHVRADRVYTRCKETSSMSWAMHEPCCYDKNINRILNVMFMYVCVFKSLYMLCTVNSGLTIDLVTRV